MIIKEYFKTRSDGVRLNRTYSDKSVLIRKVGTEETYSEAIDVEGAKFQYEETDTPINEHRDI